MIVVSVALCSKPKTTATNAFDQQPNQQVLPILIINFLVYLIFYFSNLLSHNVRWWCNNNQYTSWLPLLSNKWLTFSNHKWLLNFKTESPNSVLYYFINLWLLINLHPKSDTSKWKTKLRTINLFLLYLDTKWWRSKQLRVHM